jgi:hypothetical protein
MLDLLWSEVGSICLLKQQSACVARGNMMREVKIVAVFSICTVFITALGTSTGFAARADDLGTAVSIGVNRLRETGAIGDDSRLAVAAQRHANDMLKNGVDGHIDSDGSSPQARITDAATPGRATPVRSSTGAPDPPRLRA